MKPASPIGFLAILFVFLFAAFEVQAAAPVVDDFSASSTSVAPGGIVTLTVQVHDPDCPDSCTSGCGQYIRHDLTTWTATGGTIISENNGVASSPYTASAEWQAPDVEATYTVSVRISDSGSFICGGRQNTTVDLDIVVTTNPNQPPQVDSLTATPPRVFPGQVSNLLCTGSDPDEEPLIYSWDSDAGTVTGGTDGAAEFSSDDPAVATVTCTVTDSGGASASDSVEVSVVGAVADQALTDGLSSPSRLSIDSYGYVYVVDRAAGGINVVDLFDGRYLYRLPMPGVLSVAVDWNDHLLIGTVDGARLTNRAGGDLGVSFGGGSGDVADVAVDPVRRRYGVLHESIGRVTVHDEFGAPIVSFGSTGDAPEQLRGPQGIDVNPGGQWIVADTGHGLIKVFDGSGALQSSFGGLGGGAGEFVRLDDVAVDDDGVIYASDAFQDWIQAFNPDGTLRETLGTYGGDVGEFRTAAGIAPSVAFDRVLAASVNSSSIQVFRTSDVVFQPPGAAVATVTPDSLEFPEQPAGSTSAVRSVALANTGASPLGLQAIHVQGSFVQSNDCGPVLDVGQTCVIEITFRPDVAGLHSGVLTLDTSGNPSRVAVGLSGASVPSAAVVSLSPASLTFGNQSLGTVSPPLSVTLTNTGNASLGIYGIDTSPHYVQGNDCPASLAPGAGCNIDVSFAPLTIAADVYGFLNVIAGSESSPHSVFLQGSSTPLQPLVAIDDQTIDEGDAGDTTEAVFTVSLSEPTTETSYVEYMTVSGSAHDPDDFEAATGTLTFPPGETVRTIPVTVLGDGILEPDEEDFFVQLANPVNAILDDDRGFATITDDEPCVGPGLGANTGGESRPDGAEIPGWTQQAGTWLRRGAPPLPVEGEYYLYPATTDYAELVQDFDVGAYDEKIDSGVQWFVFEAWVRTLYEAPDDTARIVVEYRDLDNSFVLDTFDSGEFSSPGAWISVGDTRVAPIGTRWIRVRLISNYLGDAYFDAVSLRSLRAATVTVADAEEYEGHQGFTQAAFGLTLACPFHEEVRIDYGTADATAVVGEDYLAELGTVSLPTGETSATIDVSIVADRMDEGHESFLMNLDLVQPSDALLLGGAGVCRIVNDDFCSQGHEYWREAPGLWPVDWLEIGGVEYDQAELLDLLFYEGSDESHQLAKALITTKLNLAMGSDPAIWPTVDDADAFLTQYPPGSRPSGKAKRTAVDLVDLLSDYNNGGCSSGGNLP